jgi:hypothetical protein
MHLYQEVTGIRRLPFHIEVLCKLCKEDTVRLQNYANYQSVCLAQNIDDIAQDLIQTKSHMNGLHSEIDSLENNQEHMKSQLEKIFEKLEIIQTAVFTLKYSFEEENKTPSPLQIEDIERHASFKWFSSSSSKEEHKQLTLKQLAKVVPNPALARIVEVLEIAVEKIELVKKQSSKLEDDIKKASQARIPSIKAIDDAESSTKNAPRSSHDDASGNVFQSAWEKWCNAKYGSSKKVPFDPANSSEHASFSRENIESAPITNLNCRSKTEIMMIIQK